MDGMEWETATKKTTPPKEDVKEDPVRVRSPARSFSVGKEGPTKLGGNLCSRSNAAARSLARSVGTRHRARPEGGTVDYGGSSGGVITNALFAPRPLGHNLENIGKGSRGREGRGHLEVGRFRIRIQNRAVIRKSL